MSKRKIAWKRIITIFSLLIAFIVCTLFIKDRISYSGKFSNNFGNVIIGTGNSGFIKILSLKDANITAENFNTSHLFISLQGSLWKESLIDDIGDVRCKDIYVGDADNDGKNEVLLGTHGEGYVIVYKKNSSKWDKTILEHNFIGKIDQQRKMSHKVDRKDLTYDTLVNSAVHIVKSGDVDNDGKNEVVATISSPLEFLADEISFIRVYKLNESINAWQDYTVDELHGREFRSIAIGDVYNEGRNSLIIGIGSPGQKPGSVYIYSYDSGKWEKTLLHNDSTEKNMKGLVIGDLENDGENEIVLATGFPKGIVHIFHWNKEEKKFSDKVIGAISELFNISEAQFNSMAAEIVDFDLDGNKEILVAGTTTFPNKKIGWEGADSGYLVLFKIQPDGSWEKRLLNSNNVLSLDIKNKKI
ncbi:MAG: hypothetical protein NTV63_03485 [Candidatus Woesearchaeota archaeon]|nr:hypothetical protein [Candidatus Woesearchaeota archaeon]